MTGNLLDAIKTDRRKIMAGAAALGLAGGLAGLSRAAAFADMSPGAPVDTSAGRVRGFVENDVHVFRGIPYGAPTGGQARFKAPRPCEPWTGVKNAFAWGFDAPQPPSANPSSEYQLALGIGSLQRAQSEDCLYLNLWTPDIDNRRRPVMVWLHGGGFARGSGAAANTDGAALAAHGDVVVITVNHRLNTLGCTYLDHLGGEEFSGSGNASVLDLVLALEWVRDNVSRFGGDPGNVTIFGFSGGGQKVSTLMAMPAARGLFHRAIVQSGQTPRLLNAEQASEHTDRLFRYLGIARGDLAALQAVPVDRVVAGFAAISNEPPVQIWGLPARFSPLVDGTSIPHHPVAPEAVALTANVPVMIGSIRDEMAHWTLVWHPDADRWDFAAVGQRLGEYLGERAPAVLAGYRRIHPQASPWDLFTLITADYPTRFNSIRLADLWNATGGAPTYMYRVDWQTPVMDGRLKAPHGMEVAMIFRNVGTDANVNGGGPDAVALSNAISDAWIAFARHGDPSTQALAWPAYETRQRQTMLFDRTSRAVSDPGGDERRFLETVAPPL